MKSKTKLTTKRLCRAGVIAALYVALTMVFGTISYSGIFEIRPAEALTILPLFYPEAVPALWIGCMLANLTSPFMLYDVLLGGLATLVASSLTYLAGRLIRNNIARVAVGGLFPVFVNAFAIPLIIVFLCGGADGYESISAAYWIYFASMVVTEGVWVYVLGSLLYSGIHSLRKKGVRVFIEK
ncbi:MAG: QueT transporter family protein [Clostridia bacterium]|nr:QueT transporter family protein [Clostridia bacterium]